MRLELALESNKFALEVTLKTLEAIQNWCANFAAVWSDIARIARSDFNATARSCIARSDFNAAAWSCIARSNFNAAAWVSNNSVTARAVSAATFAA